MHFVDKNLIFAVKKTKLSKTTQVLSDFDSCHVDSYNSRSKTEEGRYGNGKKIITKKVKTTIKKINGNKMRNEEGRGVNPLASTIISLCYRIEWEQLVYGGIERYRVFRLSSRRMRRRSSLHVLSHDLANAARLIARAKFFERGKSVL